jgi:hypothetical protein
VQHGTSVPSSRPAAVLALELHAHLSLKELHHELERNGAIVRAAPFEVSWQKGTYQLEVEDPDGNLLLLWGD